MSKLGATALAVAVGYLLFRLLLGSAKLLYLLCKIAVLLPFAIFALCAGNATISRNKPLTAEPAYPPLHAPAPESVTASPPPAPDLGPATIESTGDWRQDREILKQLLAEGKIK